jgi:hypothetical protein
MPSRRWYTTGTEGIKGVTGVGPDQLAVNRQTSCSKTTSRVRTLRSVITTTLFLFQNELWGLGYLLESKKRGCPKRESKCEALNETTFKAEVD